MTLPAGFLDECKARVPLSRLVGRQVEWDRRETNPARGDFWACCPFHAEKTPSFHVDDRKGFYHCFGCSASGDAIGFLRALHGWSFIEAVRELAAEAGIELPDPEGGARRPAARGPDPEREARRRQREAEAEREAARGFDRARRIWEEAREGDPLLMRYLEARGVATEALRRAWGGPPPTLRLHPSLAYWADVPGQRRKQRVYQGPAMVGLIGRAGQVGGVHCTWISETGRAELRGQKLDKKWMGRTRAMFGLPVVLASERATGRMVAGEGIETTLAWWSHAHLAHLAGRGPKWSAEAALSRGALAGGADGRFRGRCPRSGAELPSAVPDFARPNWLAPDWVDHLVILGEGSRRHPEAAERESWRAQRRHAWRPDGTPRRCELLLPPGGWGSGLDFADVAAGEAA